MEWGQGEEWREGNRLEAKRAKGGVPASLWETYSAFANTEGGVILLGVQEDFRGALHIEGLTDADTLLKKFWDGVNNPSKVSANLLTGSDAVIEEVDGLRYIRIAVPRAPRQLRPVYVGKDRERGTYRRSGEGDYHCSPEEVLAMVRDASPAALDALVLEEFSLDALDAESVERFRATLEAVRPNHPWAKLPFEDLLIKLNAAGRVEGEGALHPTRAGLLMFGYEYEIVREYPDYFLDYREMGEGTRWLDRVVSNDGTRTGGVFDFWSAVVPRLTAGVKRPFALSDTLQRVEDTTMHAALREAFVNALVHADYYGRRGIVALRFPEKVEVANPGGLRIALDAMMAGGVSDARNPTLMKMFGLINACEKAGSGFDTMRRAAREAQAEAPQAQESFNPDRVTVTVYLGNAASTAGPAFSVATAENSLADSVVVPLGEDAVVGLSKDERAVAELGAQEGEFTRRDIEILLDCGPTKAKGVVSALLARGIIEAKGVGRSTRYVLSGR